MMSEKLDDASYNEGRAAFDTGVSLRSVVEQFLAAETPADEAKTLSAALGFADGLLDQVRTPVWPREVVVEHSDGTVSLFSQVEVIDGTIRARRAGDVFRAETGVR
jgi:hypothetical protein